MKAREDVASGFFVARGDVTKLLDILEETFNQVALRA